MKAKANANANALPNFPLSEAKVNKNLREVKVFFIFPVSWEMKVRCTDEDVNRIMLKLMCNIMRLAMKFRSTK